jgi:hypothetical protein
MITHRVHLSIPAERYVALYAGKVKFVRAVSEGGLRVEFPGSILNRFVTHDGVHGVFEFKIDSLNKLKSVSRIN